MKQEKKCARYGIFPCKCSYCYNKIQETKSENQKNRKKSLEKRRLRMARKAQKYN